jgi:multicomponent Na+:H+ antiporter subunit E
MSGQTGGPLRRAAIRCVRTPGFLGYYGWLFLKANAAVAREIVAPRSTLAPAVVELRLRGHRPLEIAVLAHLISLTPGTLALEVRADPPTLFLHGMHAADPQRFRDQLSELEDRLLAVMRPTGGDDT